MVLTLAHDRHVGHGGIDGLDIGGFANEAVVHHQQRINRLMCAGGAERMAGERLGGADRRRLVAEHLADGFDLLDIADGRGGGVGVDVVDAVHVLQRRAHAARSAFAGRLHHVVAVGGGAVADELAVDAGAASLGVLELLENDDAGAAGNDEAVAGDVIGAARDLRAVVEVRRHGVHGVEQDRQRPIELLAAASKHDVLLAPLDQLAAIADAMRRGRAGR